MSEEKNSNLFVGLTKTVKDFFGMENYDKQIKPDDNKNKVPPKSSKSSKSSKPIKEYNSPKYYSKFLLHEYSQYTYGGGSSCTFIATQMAIYIFIGYVDLSTIPHLEKGPSNLKEVNSKKIDEIYKKIIIALNGGIKEYNGKTIKAFDEAYVMSKYYRDNIELSKIFQEMLKPTNSFVEFLSRMERKFEETGKHQCVILTKPPETILVYYNKNLQWPFVVFDSHTRMFEANLGAGFYFFNSVEACNNHLSELFAYIPESEILPMVNPYLSVEQAITSEEFLALKYKMSTYLMYDATFVVKRENPSSINDKTSITSQNVLEQSCIYSPNTSKPKNLVGSALFLNCKTNNDEDDLLNDDVLKDSNTNTSVDQQEQQEQLEQPKQVNNDKTDVSEPPKEREEEGEKKEVDSEGNEAEEVESIPNIQSEGGLEDSIVIDKDAKIKSLMEHVSKLSTKISESQEKHKKEKEQYEQKIKELEKKVENTQLKYETALKSLETDSIRASPRESNN